MSARTSATEEAEPVRREAPVNFGSVFRFRLRLNIGRNLPGGMGRHDRTVPTCGDSAASLGALECHQHLRKPLTRIPAFKTRTLTAALQTMRRILR